MLKIGAISTRQFKRLRWLLLFAVMGFGLAEALWQSQALGLIDRPIQDFWFQLQGQRASASH
ncbi:MAG: hypothetical protein PHH58_11765, partial [Rhodoferax sp.]|nr:hypothetical protein [Rhodoferax sp.]